MKHLTSLALASVLFLAACTDTTGLSADSTRTPRGNPNAAVLVEKFADLQCPACRSAHTLINEPLLQTYDDEIRFEFKHFPLRSIHRFALDAAMGAECAADQGKFWEFADMAFEKQPEMSREAIKAWAVLLNLDAELFNRCVDSNIKRDTVLADFDEGTDRDVTGTPTYFVNGQRVESDLAAISAAINAALDTGMRL